MKYAYSIFERFIIFVCDDSLLVGQGLLTPKLHNGISIKLIDELDQKYPTKTFDTLNIFKNMTKSITW